MIAALLFDRRQECVRHDVFVAPIDAAPGKDGLVVIEGQGCPHQPIVELAGLNVQRLHVLSQRLTLIGFLVNIGEHDLECTIAFVSWRIPDKHNQMGADRGRNRSRGRTGKLDTAQINPGGGPRDRAQLDVVHKQGGNDLHSSKLSANAHTVIRSRHNARFWTQSLDGLVSATMSTDQSRSSGTTLSEQQSKTLLASYAVPFLDERTVSSALEAVSAADDLGYPVVAKLNGEAIAHKTERGLVRLNLGSSEAVSDAATKLLAAATEEDGEVSVLVAPMVQSNREFICGTSTDPQFGPTVLLGVGGILAEAIADVSIRLIPITAQDAMEMIDDLKTQDLIGAFRGEPAIDREQLAGVLVALSDAVVAEPRILSIDLNPVLIVDGSPVSVDALVETDGTEGAQ